MTDSAADMWSDFLASEVPEAEAARDATYTSWYFGTGGGMADELAELVLAGRKRATAGALWAYQHDGEDLPRPGDYSVITDGSGTACCIIRTTQVDIVPFCDVDASFAAEEGEGDLSLRYWRAGHWKYFTLELAEFGAEPALDMPVVCERFEVVHPTGQSRA